MSSLEGNKIAAAILVGGMVTLSVGILTDFVYRPHHAAEAAHEGEGGAAPAAPSQKPVEPVLGLIAKADAAKGETIAKKCQTCHSFDAAGTNKVGPGLYGVVGRMAGTHEGFAYSDPMKNHGKPWTPQEVGKLEALVEHNTPTRVIGLKLGRTEDSIYAKASEEQISLKPTNQRPYGMRKR